MKNMKGTKGVRKEREKIKKNRQLKHPNDGAQSKIGRRNVNDKVQDKTWTIEIVVRLSKV
jgi:hypothetical protein